VKQVNQKPFNHTHLLSHQINQSISWLLDTNGGLTWGVLSYGTR